MKKIILWTLVSCLLATAGFSQAINATLTGTVADSTGAVLPGVTITSTNNATGVASTILTNEAGAYNLQGLIPGTYTVSGELPGFQKQTYTNVALGNAVTVRLNFTLQVATQSQSVEVTVDADTVLATSSPTIGQVLSEKKVNEVPIVGNNVLDMLNVLGGLDNLVFTSANPSAGNAFGRESTTLAGVSAGFTPVLRDGVMVQDTRWPTGINSATVINPDLVGEIRLIVSPVDAELGRGNGAVQITTRSGTNEFHGAGVWSIQNSAMNANTWSNNRAGLPTNFFNTNQFTGSIGGPIVRNKTFFYALVDRNMNRQRANTYATVLTPCARNGVFRYFDNWNSGAVGANLVRTGNPVRAVVDPAGNPVTPTDNPNGSPYTSQLRHISVFGPVTFPSSGPNGDCSNGTVTGSWDAFRTRQDPTGLISRTMGLMPLPNDFTNANNALNSVDGLNIAAFRYVRKFRGLDNLFSVGEATGDRYQYNGRIDHNFNGQNKVHFNFSYELVSSDDVVAGLPDTWNNENYHRPMVLNGNWTSTLSASIVNEARFGYRKTGTNVVSPWDRDQNREEIDQYLPARVNGFRTLPNIWNVTGGWLCSPISGARPPGNCAGGNITTTATDESPLWTYSDTISWSTGKHTFKLGGDLRFASSTTRNAAAGSNFFGNSRAPAVLAGGAAPGAPLAVTGTTAIARSNPNMSGIGVTDSTRARNLLNFLAGSLSSVSNQYFLTDPGSSSFSDGRTQDFVTNTVSQREFDFFFKDDYKIGRSLTLNLGVRYEYYGVPYSPAGLAVAPVGGSGAAFGYSGRDFSGWMHPGARRGEDLIVNFVGPNSPNEGQSVHKKDWNNIGPAVGFAWSPSWLGADRTTIRGGYQITFQGGSRFSPLEVPLTYPPGRIYDASYTGDTVNRYLDLATVSAAGVLPAPLPAGVAPMTPIPITDRSQNISVIDTHYVSPYVQNLNLSITRSVRNNLTVDFRYVGTLVRSNYTSINLNSANFLYNGLLEEFNRVRTGGESAALDAMMNGINICATSCTAGVQFGAIGTSVGGIPQTAALQMRAHSSFNSNLANANYNTVANNLARLNYFKVGCPARGAAGNCDLPDVNTSVVRGSVLRVNGAPENFILTNPQFNNVNYLANMGNSNYHSFQAETTLRPTHGLSGTANYTWSRNLGLPNSFTNPVERHLDYSIVNNNHNHIFRAHGNVELPFGPGRPLLGNSSGVLARAMEGWRVGFVYNLSTGNWMNFGAQSTQYANGVPDVVNADLYRELIADAGVHWDIPTSNNFTEGSYFDPASWTKTADPQCGAVSPSITQGSVRCLLQAVAKIVPANTPSAVVTARDAAGNPTQHGVIVLQNPQPGQRGNLGQNVIKGPAVWRFDTNLEKSFSITETKSLRFRADAFNVLNHPQPGNPNLSINPNLNNGAAIPFGQITSKTGGRTFQGQLRFQF
jgi:hypothetical protein